MGAKWTYGIGYAFSPGVSYVTWEVKADTLVSGQWCRVIQREGNAFADFSSEIYAYEDSGRVFWYNPTLQDFSILYDFNAMPSDTWSISIDTCTFLATVDSVGTVTLNGQVLRSIHITTTPIEAFSGVIIEGIGHINHFIPEYPYSCLGLIYDADYYNGLRCYEDTVIGFVDFGIAPSCDYMTVGIPECVCAVPEFRFYPNPASGTVNLIAVGKIEADEVCLFDITGRMVYRDDFMPRSAGHSIPLHGLSSGIYLAELRYRGQRAGVQRLVVAND